MQRNVFPSTVTPRLLAGVIGLLVVLGSASPAAAATSATVSFQFFDESGNKLTHSQVVARMTNHAGSSFMSTGTMDLPTLKALTLNIDYSSNGLFTIPFTNLTANPKQGLMVHWNTANTGYSTFLLDNGGNGFTQSETLVFNEQLAKDAHRQFNDAYARRTTATPPYVPSTTFVNLKAVADTCMLKLAQATALSFKGKYGQECLDDTVQAMALMLKEYGVQNARALEQRQVYGTWGVSTETLSTSYRAHIDDMTTLFEPRHRWARLVMDEVGNSDFAKVRTVLNYATSKQVQTLGQLFDSSVQSSLSLTAFKAAVDKALAYPDFDKFTAWEVGNEVNGGWLGSGMSAKIAYASAQVKAKTQKKVYLTFYWYGIEDTLQTSLFNWIDANITPEMHANIDGVALSIYIDQQPLGFSWDLVMTRLAALFPGKAIMVGELGFIDPSVKTIFREGPVTPSDNAGGQLYIDNRYPASFGTANAVGGNFWWFYDQQMAGRQPLWNALHSTYCQIYQGYADVSHVCGGAL